SSSGTIVRPHAGGGFCKQCCAIFSPLLVGDDRATRRARPPMWCTKGVSVPSASGTIVRRPRAPRRRCARFCFSPLLVGDDRATRALAQRVVPVLRFSPLLVGDD